MKKILISACLAGDRVRYDGKRVPVTDIRLRNWHQNGHLVKICPEVMGGLKIPRPAARIMNGNGLDVLNKKAGVLDIEGHDLTLSFIMGAEYALSLAEKFDIEFAILKEKSPSCGVHHIYDGGSDSCLIPGCGVTTAILKQNRIKVFSENELDQVEILLRGG